MSADEVAVELEACKTTEEVVYCALPSWYSTFRHCTIKSEFIELAQDFVDYLSSDGIVLPQGCELSLVHQGRDEEEGRDEWEDTSLETPTQAAPAFPELLPHISAAISALEGRGVVPKLNWSAPKDAVWIATTNSLCCTTAAEVILLLKSSCFIAHDVSRVSEVNASRQPPLQCTLCLRQWRDINASFEFRCFVRDGGVIGACQRDSTTHYPFLLPLKEQLLREIISFHRHRLLHRVTLANYVFDTFREESGEMVLVDLNPFCSLTDSLLYSWEELEAWQGEAWQGEVQLRLVEAGCIQPSQLQSFRLPEDIMDLSTGEDINKFVDLFQSNHKAKAKS